MTLALLLTAVGGAWAQGTLNVVELEVPANWENDYSPVTAAELTGFKASTLEEAKAWTGAPAEGLAVLIYAFDGEDAYYVPFTNGKAGTEDKATFPKIMVFGESYSKKFYYTAEPAAPAEPAIEVTLDDAKSEASFKMPQYDVTATYTIKRDISVDVTATMGDGTDGVRYRVKKSEQVPGKYEPAEMNMMQVLALVAVNDGIEQKALTLGQDYFCRIYKLDEQTLQPLSADGVKLADFDFAPGLYALKAFAKDGSDYAGETALSNTFQLFQGYEVEVPAGEYVTYYKDENLYVEDEDAKLYTITSVGTETATAAPLTVAKAYTPILVKNKGAEKKVILLIPTETEGDDVTAAPEFIGTLEATTIAASSENQNNYAFNGLQFVWVKNAIEVGANKAWLSINTGVPSARITIVFDETTGIDEMVNGQWSMVNGTWYDLNGRKLDKMPTKKGVYIMNGKKVVVK